MESAYACVRPGTDPDLWLIKVLCILTDEQKITAKELAHILEDMSMKMTDLEKMLVNELMAYRLEIEPLRDTDEEEYDEAYDAWLETLHAEIETYLEDKNLL